MEGKTTLTEFRKMNSVKKKRIVRKNMWCWVFMLPTLLLYILFQGYPIITSAWYSMLDWSGMTMNATFVGLQNFKELLADPLFKNSIVNSFKYMIFSVPIQLILSLVIAYILTSIIRKGATVFRTMYFIPVITTASIVGIIMIFIFGGTGPINQVLALLGIDTINFLGDEKTALFTVVLIGIWKDLGTYMIYWIAALQSVSQDVYEAAKIDGANFWQRLRYITLPMLSGAVMINLVFGITYGLKVFDIVYVLTNGGPGHATEVLTTYAFQLYSRGQYGMSSALNTVLLVITAIIGVFIVKTLSKQEVQQ